MMRFYDPQQGRICINDTDLKNINTVNLRDNIAYITQQTYIFNETVYEKYCVGKPQGNKRASD